MNNKKQKKATLQKTVKDPFHAQYVRYIGQVTAPRKNKFQFSTLNGHTYRLRRFQKNEEPLVIGDTVIIATMVHSHENVKTWNLHEIRLPAWNMYKYKKEACVDPVHVQIWFRNSVIVE